MTKAHQIFLYDMRLINCDNMSLWLVHEAANDVSEDGGSLWSESVLPLSADMWPK